jgi:hypothetical protein
MRNAHNILVENPEGKTPLVKPKSRLEDNIKMYLREIRWEDVDWVHLVQDHTSRRHLSKFLQIC